MSVAIGMPMPACVGVPALSAKWISAGATMPPTAANIGSSAFLQVRELAAVELALELEADEQEEDRHQPVVDPVLEGETAELRLPEGEVAVRRAANW